LAAHGLQSQMESTVEHGPNYGIGERSRTMTSQRMANSGLTGCLSLGVHRTSLMDAFADGLPRSTMCAAK
jgi:hypothetical protein